MRRISNGQILFLVVLLLVFSQNGERIRGAIAGDDSGKVVRVTDGDTITVNVDGKREKVRYIGVDTPETVKPGVGVQCFGKRAAARNRELVDGKTVKLIYDRERRDRYGRTLAYVEVDGQDVGGSLIAGGYATAKSYPPNTARERNYRRIERGAREANEGLWGACDVR